MIRAGIQTSPPGKYLPSCFSGTGSSQTSPLEYLQSSGQGHLLARARCSFTSLLWPKPSVMTMHPKELAPENRAKRAWNGIMSSQLATDASTPSFFGFWSKLLTPIQHKFTKSYSFKTIFLFNWIHSVKRFWMVLHLKLILFFKPLILSFWSYKKTQFFPANLTSFTSLFHHSYTNTSTTHCDELCYSAHASNVFHTTWKAKFCHLSSQLEKGALFGDSLFSLTVRTTLSNNKKLYSDLTLVLYCPIHSDYKTSHCKSYHRRVSSVLSHWHTIQKLYTSSQGALVSCGTLLRNKKTNQTGKSHTDKGDS